MRVRSIQRMLEIISGMASRELMKMGLRALLVAGCGALVLPLAAQRQGPLPPPPSGTVAPSGAPAGPAKASTARQEPHITNDPPAMPVDQIIQKFTQHEEEFRRERDNFTYTQIFVFQEIDENGQPDGEYRLTSDILFTPAGKRYEKVVEAPGPTLKRISMSQQDFDDIEKVSPLVLTTHELPKYDVKYVGLEQAEQVGTYVFDLAPKKLEKEQRYFGS